MLNNFALSWLVVDNATKISQIGSAVTANCYHGPITKQGNGHARAMLVQAAQQIASHPGPLGAFFRRLVRRKNHNVAIIATARKLVVIAWHMLTANEPYRYAQPTTLQRKMDRLRLKCGAERRPPGARKGVPRSATFGTGQRVRQVPSLDQVLINNGLPSAKGLDQLSAGEKRVLRQTRTTAYVEQIQQPQQIVRQVTDGKKKTE